MIPIIDLSSQLNRIRDSIEQRIQKVLSHGQFILGPEVDELETELSNYTGSDFCITVANGTDALQIALMAIGVGPGDEVITSAFSYISPGEAISLLGAKPVFVDCDPETFLIDEGELEDAITHKTKAIIPVSLFGQTPNFDKINEIAGKKNITVIEDGAQSFGGEFKGKKSCNLSTIGCTSFFPSKPLGCYGDGGAIFTNDREIAKLMRQIARHGQDGRYNHVRLGINSRLDTLQAAILLEKLKILDLEIKERHIVAERYNKAFQDKENISIQTIIRERKSAWAQYSIRIKNRDIVKKSLEKEGISSVIHYPKPVPFQPSMPNDLMRPKSVELCKQILSLPISGNLDFLAIDKIISVIVNASDN